MSNIEAMVFFYSEDYPHSFSREFDVGQDHEEVERTDPDVWSCIVRYGENPSDVQDDCDSHNHKVEFSRPKQILPQQTIFFFKTYQSPVCSEICIDAGACRHRSTYNPVDLKPPRLVNVIEQRTDDSVEWEGNCDESNNWSAKPLSVAELKMHADAGDEAIDQKAKSEDKSRITGLN